MGFILNIQEGGCFNSQTSFLVIWQLNYIYSRRTDYKSMCLSVRRSVGPSVFPSVGPSVRLSVRWSVRPSFCRQIQWKMDSLFSEWFRLCLVALKCSLASSHLYQRLKDERTNRRTDGPTDRRTNGQTDTPSYRVNSLRLKRLKIGP